MPGSCCIPFSGEVAPYDGPMGKNEDMHSDIYDDGDICEKEVPAYKEKVNKRKDDIDCICNELKMATRMNYHRKLNVLCECTLGVLNLHAGKLRGQHGSTLLHLALGLNNVGAARVLLRYGNKELILTEMIGSQYGGMTALHLAIVNGQVEIVKTMLEMLEDEERVKFVNCQTFGSEFLQMSNIPLGLSLWCGQQDLYGVLLDAGAELDAVDKQTGNTAIHSLIMYSSKNTKLMIQMIDLVLTHEASRRWWCKKKNIPQEDYKFGPMNWKHLKQHLLSIPNNDGYTPLTLTALYGASQLLCHMYNISHVNKHTTWTYGQFSTSFYDLSETDPLIVDTGKPSVLDIVVYDGNDDKLSVIASEPIISLVKKKWRSHRLFYYSWLLYHLTLMTVFTWWITCRPLQDIYNNTEDDFLPGELSETESLAVECMIIIGACIYTATELIDIASSLHDVLQYRLRRSSTGYYKVPWSVIFRYDDFKWILIIFSVSTTIASAMRHLSNPNSDIFYCIALTCGWYYMLAFLRTFRSFSYYTVMVHRIIFSDIIRFGVVFIFILIGFTAGNIVIFATAPDGVPTQISSIETGMLSLFRLMIGLEEWDIADQARSQATASLVFIVFVLLTTILLLNMLIASMTDTYATITDHRESLRMKYLALTCLTIERRLMPLGLCKRKKASTYLQSCPGKDYCVIFVKEIKTNNTE